MTALLNPARSCCPCMTFSSCVQAQVELFTFRTFNKGGGGVEAADHGVEDDTDQTAAVLKVSCQECI